MTRRSQVQILSPAEIGPAGFIMGMGCAIPPDAKFENVQAMVDSVQQ